MAPKIDVHHHCYPPVFTDALERTGGDRSGWYVPPWTRALDVALCEKYGIALAMLSCTEPGPDCESDPVAAQKLARACNIQLAAYRDASPQSYGFFASTPSLLHPAAALTELQYAFDVLHADGVTLMTRYGDDMHYLGHPDFTPIWDFLNARHAVIFVHPTHLVDTALVNPFLAQPAFDFPHETGRTAIDLILTNTLRDHASNCKIILSHAGGTLPWLIDRPAHLLPYTPAAMNPGKSPAEILTDYRRFYFDTALSSSPGVLQLLRTTLGDDFFKDHVLFGSDFPNAPDASIEHFTEQLETNPVVKMDDLRQAAFKLFPRLQATACTPNAPV